MGGDLGKSDERDLTYLGQDNSQTADGKMRACGYAGLQFRVSSVRDKARVSDGVRVNMFYFSSHQQPAEARIAAFYL